MCRKLDRRAELPDIEYLLSSAEEDVVLPEVAMYAVRSRELFGLISGEI